MPLLLCVGVAMAFPGTDCVRLHIIRRALALGRESLDKNNNSTFPLTQCHLSDLPCTVARCFHLASAASHITFHIHIPYPQSCIAIVTSSARSLSCIDTTSRQAPSNIARTSLLACTSRMHKLLCSLLMFF